MKIVKIFFAVLAALWALALVPKLLACLAQMYAPLALSRITGSVSGILIASVISFVLFRGALRGRKSS